MFGDVGDGGRGVIIVGVYIGVYRDRYCYRLGCKREWRKIIILCGREISSR